MNTHPSDTSPHLEATMYFNQPTVFDNAVTIMDTGEHVTVAFVANPIVIELATKLYADANVTVDVVDTGLTADSGLQAFVEEHIGRIEPWTETAAADLTNDIKQTAAWWEMRKRRSSKPASVATPLAQGEERRSGLASLMRSRASEAWDAPMPQTTRREASEKPTSKAERDKAGLEPFIGDDTALGCGRLGTADDMQHLDCAPLDDEVVIDHGMFFEGACAPQDRPANTHVVFNTLLNLTFVVDGVGSRAVFMCQQLPEFELVRSLALHDDDQKASCKALFHCKLCSGMERAKQRLTSFVNLFELEDSVGGSNPGTEKDSIMQLLRTHYVITSDPSTKLQASVLMHSICDAMHVFAINDVRSLNQRLPAYFLEAGLKKKRTAQGYVYYGIRPIVQGDFAVPAPVELKTLESQRDSDLSRFRTVEVTP